MVGTLTPTAVPSTGTASLAGQPTTFVMREHTMTQVTTGATSPKMSTVATDLPAMNVMKVVLNL